MGKRLYEDICDRLDSELEEFFYSIKSDRMRPEELDVLDKLLHSVKSVSTIKAMKNAGEEWENGDYYKRGYDNGERNDSRGYSGHSEKDIMTSKLQKMMEDATDPHEREIIKSYMHKL